MKSKYSVEKRIADENFIFTSPGLYNAVGDEYYVLIEHIVKHNENGIITFDYYQIVGWSSTEKGAWSLRY